jgi:hypothetical protein
MKIWDEMSRQPKPTRLHELEGTTNPTRHADRAVEPKAHGSLGAPPDSFAAKGQAVWYELRKQVPEGVGTSCDRMAFELLCRLVVQVRVSPGDLSPALAAQLRCALGAFGMTPSDRARLSVPPPREPDTDGAEFFDD